MFVYSNQDENTKRYKARKNYLPKGVIKNFDFIISGKNFYTQLVCYDVKRNNEIKNLTTGQDEDYTTALLHQKSI